MALLERRGPLWRGKSWGDKDHVLNMLKLSGCQLKHASPALKRNRDVVLAAVREDGLALEYAAEHLRNDVSVVLSAVQQDGNSLMWASKARRNDIDVILAAVEQNEEALLWVSEDTKNNKDAMLRVAGQNAQSVWYMGHALLSDKPIVAMAVKQYGRWIRQQVEITMHHFKRKIVPREVTVGFGCKDHILLELAESGAAIDDEMLLEAMNQRGWAQEAMVNFMSSTRCSPDFFSRDPRLVRDLNAIRECMLQHGQVLKVAGRNLMWLNPELHKDRKFMLRAVQQHGLTLEYASHELQIDEEVVTAAVRQTGFALWHTGRCVYWGGMQDGVAKRVAMEAVKQQGRALQFVSTAHTAHEKEVVREAVKQDGLALNFATDELKNDLEVVLQALRQTRVALIHASEEQRSHVRGMMWLTASNRHLQSQAKQEGNKLMTVEGFRRLLVEGLAGGTTGAGAARRAQARRRG